MIIDEDTYLAHYGVKGMRWGQRKDRGTRADRKMARAEKRFNKQGSGLREEVNRDAVATEAMNNYIMRDSRAIDRKYKGVKLRNDPEKAKQYMSEHEQAFLKRLNEASDKIIGRSPKGDRRWAVVATHPQSTIDRFFFKTGPRAGEWKFELQNVQHASDGASIITIKVFMSADDRIEKIEPVTTAAVQQSAMLVDKFLAHHAATKVK